MRGVSDHTFLFAFAFFSGLNLLETPMAERLGGIFLCSLFLALLSRALRCSRVVQNRQF